MITFPLHCISHVLAAISLVLFVFYIIITRCKFGVPDSISHSFYLWGKDAGSGRLFTMFCALIPYFLMLPWIFISGEENSCLQILSIAAGLFLLLVGFTPHYKDDESWDKSLHFIFAGICAGLSLCWGYLYFVSEHNTKLYWWYLLSVIGIVFVWFFIEFLLNKKKGFLSRTFVFWLEIVMFALIYTFVFRALF